MPTPRVDSRVRATQAVLLEELGHLGVGMSEQELGFGRGGSTVGAKQHVESAGIYRTHRGEVHYQSVRGAEQSVEEGFLEAGGVAQVDLAVDLDEIFRRSLAADGDEEIVGVGRQLTMYSAHMVSESCRSPERIHFEP